MGELYPDSNARYLMSVMRKCIPVIPFLIAAGLEMSPLSDWWLSITTWSVAGILALAIWGPGVLTALAKVFPWEVSVVSKRPVIPPPPPRVYQRGLIDFWRDGELGMTRFNRALVGIAETMGDSNKKTQQLTARLVKEQKRVPVSAERVHRRTADLAQSINRYTARMDVLHAEANDAAQQMTENYTGFVRWQTDKDVLSSFRTSIGTLRDGAKQGQQGMGSLRQSVSGLQEMNYAQSVNEACGRLIDVVTGIIGTIKGVEDFTVEAFRIIDQKTGSRQVRRSASR